MVIYGMWMIKIAMIEYQVATYDLWKTTITPSCYLLIIPLILLWCIDIDGLLKTKGKTHEPPHLGIYEEVSDLDDFLLIGDGITDETDYENDIE